MADVRRQSSATAGKVATPKISGGGAGAVGAGAGTGGMSMGELDATLSKAVGARIKVVTSAPTSTTMEGTLFTACPITNLIAINTTPPPPNPSTQVASQAGDYHVIPVSRIQSFQVLALSPDGATARFTGSEPSIGRVDTRALEAREQMAIRKIKEKDAMRGKGVGREAQEIFDFLARLYPTRWHETSIVVNDFVIISKPYTVNDCAAPKDQQDSLNRVRTHLERAREKIAERASKPAVATPRGLRKGG